MFEDVRMVRRSGEKNSSRVAATTFEQFGTAYSGATGKAFQKPSAALARINQSLQPMLNEMFFTERLVLVEGLEDIAYLTSHLLLSDGWEEFRRRGCHIVPTNGKSGLIEALIVAQQFSIPTFAIWDGDSDKPDRSGSRKKHEDDNKAILKLCGSGDLEPFPAIHHWGQNFVMWSSDIGATVASEIGEKEWGSYQQATDAAFGNAGTSRKNSLYVASCLSRAWSEGRKSESLEKLRQALEGF